jgi:hypothetical protein
MFKLLSDLSTVQRKELPIYLTSTTAHRDNEVYVSGYSGSWVTLDSSGYAVLTSANTQGLSWPVWNESKRDGTQGWSPDVKQSSSVTVFFGKVRFLTDRFYGSPTLGAPLKPSAQTGYKGCLEATTLNVAGEATVAYCRKAPYNYTHFGNVISVIEVETV